MSPNVQELAATLDAAARQHEVLARPLTDEHPELDASTAYEIQERVVQARLDSGAKLVGAKLGLTSRAKQAQMQVNQPLYGWLTSDMLRPAASRLDLTRFIHPRAEPEIGFLLGRPLEAPATAMSVLSATEAVFAAIEIIDSRYANFRFRYPDVVADNASSAALVLGGVALPPSAAGDLRLTGVVLEDRGRVVATAAGAAVLGHPAEAVAWLVNELGRRGKGLAAGTLVLSGALTDAIPIADESCITARFDALGTVEVHA